MEIGISIDENTIISGRKIVQNNVRFFKTVLETRFTDIDEERSSSMKEYIDRFYTSINNSYTFVETVLSYSKEDLIAKIDKSLDTCNNYKTVLELYNEQVKNRNLEKDFNSTIQQVKCYNKYMAAVSEEFAEYEPYKNLSDDDKKVFNTMMILNRGESKDIFGKNKNSINDLFIKQLTSKECNDLLMNLSLQIDSK